MKSASHLPLPPLPQHHKSVVPPYSRQASLLPVKIQFPGALVFRPLDPGDELSLSQCGIAGPVELSGTSRGLGRITGSPGCGRFRIPPVPCREIGGSTPYASPDVPRPAGVRPKSGTIVVPFIHGTVFVGFHGENWVKEVLLLVAPHPQPASQGGAKNWRTNYDFPMGSIPT